MTRWLEPIDLDEIPVAARNAKAHDGAGIARSIERFGYVEPMVLDERTGRLVAGHGRLDDLKRRRDAGDDPPDGIVEWRGPVLRGWSSRTDAEADAAAIALNRVGEAGGWHHDLLTDLLAEISEVDPDLLAATGFAADDLESLLAQHGAPPSLDDLERDLGGYDETDGWARVTISTAQHVAAAWSRYSADFDREGDAFEALLAAVGRVERMVPE